MNSSKHLFLAALFLASPLVAAEATPVEKLLDRIIARENAFAEALKNRTPLVETYIQETADEEKSNRPPRDHYFLGRLDLSAGVRYTELINHTHAKPSRVFSLYLKKRPIAFMPAGFAQMGFIGGEGLSRTNYKFDYVRREFLGEIRCFVFDVSPTDPKSTDRFVGRIWVEEIEARIVRLNGSYTNTDVNRLFFHFDSWRVNVAPGLWVPAYVYVEESDPRQAGLRVPKFKAQVRLWGFESVRANKLDELTSVLIESEGQVRDKQEEADPSPIESQRLWERQSEQNIIERLQKAGMLAPKGQVDAVLNTVVTNLIVTNNLNIDVKCRVLLTTPLETFSIGQTIVISRGLVDVLPDEASLAMALSGELAHIALGHKTNTLFAFHNQTMVADETLLERARLARSELENAAAAKKAVSILAASPYKDKLGNAGLFLQALAAKTDLFPNLLRANIGNQLATGPAAAQMQELVRNGPALDESKLEQIAALPLGSRIRVDPWSNQIGLLKARPVSLLSAREKLPFEVSPFMIHLRRVEAAASTVQRGANAQP